MQLENKLLFLFLSIFLFPSNSFALITNLKKLSPKQNIQNIRFITMDGRFTYFQNSQGELILSNNYALDTIIKGPPQTQFEITGSPTRKKIIISMHPFFLLSQRVNQDRWLYVSDWGSASNTPIGKGLSPMLHLKDSWVSFSSEQSRKIIFQSLTNQNTFEINLQNSINTYFIPSIIMITEKDILYTDINDKGLQAIILLDRNLNKTQIMEKANTPGTRLEICLKNNKLFIGEFAHPGVNFKSVIKMLELDKSKDFSKAKTIYQSSRDDIGHIECHGFLDDQIYFIKSTTSDPKLPAGTESELALLNLKNLELKIVSDLKTVSQIINMDGRILIPFQSEFYVIEETNEIKNDKLEQEKDKKVKTNNE